jgi:hypothetical protein
MRFALIFNFFGITKMDARQQWYELYLSALLEIAEAELVTGIEYIDNPDLYGDKSRHAAPIKNQKEDDVDYQGAFGQRYLKLEKALEKSTASNRTEIAEKLKQAKLYMVSQLDEILLLNQAKKLKRSLYYEGNKDEVTIINLLKTQYDTPHERRQELAKLVAHAHGLESLSSDELENKYYDLLKIRHPKYKKVWEKIDSDINDSRRKQQIAWLWSRYFGTKDEILEKSNKTHVEFVQDKESRFRAQVLHEARIKEQWEQDRDNAMLRGLTACKWFAVLCGIATFSFSFWLFSSFLPVEAMPITITAAAALAYVNILVNNWVANTCFGILWNFFFNEYPKDKTPLVNRIKRSLQDFWGNFPYSIFTALDAIFNKRNVVALGSLISGVVWGSGIYRAIFKAGVSLFGEEAIIFSQILAAYSGIMFGLVFAGLCFENALKVDWNLKKYFQKLFRVGAVANKLRGIEDAHRPKSLVAKYVAFAVAATIGLVGTAATGTYPLRWFFKEVGFQGDFNIFGWEIGEAYLLSMLVSVGIGVLFAFSFYVGGSQRTILEATRGKKDESDNHGELEALRQFKNQDPLGIEAMYGQTALQQDDGNKKTGFAAFLAKLSPFRKGFSKGAQNACVVGNATANVPAATIGLMGLLGPAGGAIGGACAGVCSASANSAGEKPDERFASQVEQARQQRVNLAAACNKALVDNINLYINKRTGEEQGVGTGADSKDVKISAATQLASLAALVKISSAAVEADGRLVVKGTADGESTEKTVTFTKDQHWALRAGRLHDHAVIVADRFAGENGAELASHFKERTTSEAVRRMVM